MEASADRRCTSKAGVTRDVMWVVSIRQESPAYEITRVRVGVFLGARGWTVRFRLTFLFPQFSSLARGVEGGRICLSVAILLLILLPFCFFICFL